MIDRKEFQKGISFGLGIVLTIGLLFGIVYAAGFHSTSEILPGIFQGNYTFNGNLNVNGTLTPTNLNLDYSNVTAETTRTINIYSTDSNEEILTKINNISKYIPRDVTITIQFHDGTYIINESLRFDGFYGGGIINIQGNRSETNANIQHTTQQVILDGTSGLAEYNPLIGFAGNSVIFYVYNFRMDFSTNGYGIHCHNNPSLIQANYNYFLGPSATSTGGVGMYLNSCQDIVSVYNTFSNMNFALYAYRNSYVFSQLGYSTGTTPRYGLGAVHGSVIGKYDATQPSGSTSSELVQAGSVIR